ncbi:MAG: ABC transporter ATP-binding protein [Pseudolabrys sp.]
MQANGGDVPALELRGLCKSFDGLQATRDVTLRVMPGDRKAIIDDITEKSSFETVRTGMGLVPQGRRVFPTLSVEENLLVAERSPERHNWNLERVYALFPRLRERRNQRAKTLSGGEQQMLAIGRALMTNPDCLIMDEPSEGLAPIIIQGLWEAIGKLKEQGLSILLVEQNANLALKLVDYVHVMSKGQVVYSSKPDELTANDEVKSNYLGI